MRTCYLRIAQNACTAHRVHDRLWNPQAMDGGSLMAGAVRLVHQMSLDADQTGAAAGSDENDDACVATLMEYVESWKHAGQHIMEAISNGAEVCLPQSRQT